jgi:hypothetical protein
MCSNAYCSCCTNLQYSPHKSSAGRHRAISGRHLLHKVPGKRLETSLANAISRILSFCCFPSNLRCFFPSLLPCFASCFLHKEANRLGVSKASPCRAGVTSSTKKLFALRSLLKSNKPSLVSATSPEPSLDST